MNTYLAITMSRNSQTNQLKLMVLSPNYGIMHRSAVISVYYALFYSHMIYASPVWSLTSKGNLDQISILQKKCIRLIHFPQYNSHTSMLFAKDNLPKFGDIITSNKLALDYNFKAFPDALCNLFQLNILILCILIAHVSNPILCEIKHSP